MGIAVIRVTAWEFGKVVFEIEIMNKSNRVEYIGAGPKGGN